ncbi:hypothetical protein [Streptomyces sp. SID2888]|uniref:hypothetical protein n=1 Tax=Streptomyces sp. SID2888 TaxID=2690256 RepID=UPI001369786E|nr:hypothetical protein [Streptomyces sp. SID2888]MYV45134.1 hypothetical protein [Streptomyces sp. SID2888]
MLMTLITALLGSPAADGGVVGYVLFAIAVMVLLTALFLSLVAVFSKNERRRAGALEVIRVLSGRRGGYRDEGETKSPAPTAVKAVAKQQRMRRPRRRAKRR